MGKGFSNSSFPCLWTHTHMLSLPRKEISGEGESGKPELSGFVSSLCLCRVGKETISVQSNRLPSLGIMISCRTVPWMRDLSPALIAWLSKVPSYFFSQQKPGPTTYHPHSHKQGRALAQPLSTKQDRLSGVHQIRGCNSRVG